MVCNRMGNHLCSYGLTYWSDVLLGTTKSPQESLRKAAELSKKSLSIDASQGAAYVLLGHISILRKDWEKGMSLLYHGVELEPNGSSSHMWLGFGLCFAGQPDEAIPILKKAIRLNPVAPAQYFNAMAIAYRMVGQYDKAIEYLERGTQRNPNHLFSHLNLSACYILAGREQEAYAESKEVLRLNPKFTIDQFDKALQLKNQEEKKRFIGALRKAFSGQSDS
jgi:adenylate cyclase